MTDTFIVQMGKHIDGAKKKVESAYKGDRRQGRWLDTFRDPGGSETLRIRILVLEGTPFKGYVVANYGTGIVRAFNAWDVPITTNRVQNGR